MMRKGQAAMEYLMTYGWAILVIVVVLAALLYLGVFNVPTPERCQLQTGINCLSYRLAAAGTMTATLSNGLQKEITVDQIRCTQEQAFSAGSNDLADTGTNKYQDITNVKIPVGSSISVGTFNCLTGSGALASGGTVGSSYVGKLYVKYFFTDETSSAYRVNAGEINLKYQP